LSDSARVPRAVLDTDVIFSRVLHDLFGRLARRLRLFDLLWSDELLAEAKKSLIERKQLADDAAQRWVDYLPQGFPAGHTQIDKALATLELSELTTDPDDYHVCALAVSGQADYLITHDQGYLPAGLQQHGVEVLAPDTFLCPVFDEQPQAMLDILELQAHDWGGGRPIGDLLDAIERAQAPAFAARVRQALSES